MLTREATSSLFPDFRQFQKIEKTTKICEINTQILSEQNVCEKKAFGWSSTWSGRTRYRENMNFAFFFLGKTLKLLQSNKELWTNWDLLKKYL